MPMRSPSDLASSAYNVREYVGSRPRIRVVYQAIDFVIRSVVDSESLLDEIFPDEGSQVLSRAFGLLCKMVSELVGEVFGRVGGVDEHIWVPTVDWVRVMEFCSY